MRATTDEKGEFRIKGVEFSRSLVDFRERFGPDGFAVEHDGTRRGIILTVEAADYAPELIFVDPASSPLEMQLDTGEFVSGQVVEETGMPIEGVSLRASTWRGQDLRLGLEAETDAQGRFQFSHVPSDAVEYEFGKEGYMIVSEFSMLPSPDEYTVVLKPEVRIIGSVTDAETGKPVREFSLIYGIDNEDGSNIEWSRWESRTITHVGRYEMTLDQEQLSWRLRVEAEGYMPAESRIFRLYNPDKGEITYDFKLTKAAPLNGVVLGLDDKPLANADVYLATQHLNIQNHKVTSTEVPPVKTDAAGRFQFSPEVEPFCIVVVHEQGIGMITEAECERPPTITINPWESVKDQLQIIRKPAQGQHSDFP